MIETKEQLFQAIADLQASNSELNERLDTLQNPTTDDPGEPDDPGEEKKDKDRSDDELDEIEKMLKE